MLLLMMMMGKCPFRETGAIFRETGAIFRETRANIREAVRVGRHCRSRARDDVGDRVDLVARHAGQDGGGSAVMGAGCCCCCWKAIVLSPRATEDSAHQT